MIEMINPSKMIKKVTKNTLKIRDRVTDNFTSSITMIEMINPSKIRLKSYQKRTKKLCSGNGQLDWVCKKV